jgi:hypothetical protein
MNPDCMDCGPCPQWQQTVQLVVSHLSQIRKFVLKLVVEPGFGRLVVYENRYMPISFVANANIAI